MPARWRTLALVLALAGAIGAGAAEEFALVAGGQPAALVVTAATPTPAAKLAAAELVRHLAQATGATLAVVVEPDVPATPTNRIYLGDTAAARAAGLALPDGPPGDAFVRRVTPTAAYLVGHDSAAGDPLAPATSVGTLCAVYDLLETDAGVRWLWPGELGTVVPARRDLALPVAAADRRWQPLFAQRRVRWSVSLWRNAKPAPDQAQYQADLKLFLRRQRLGGEGSGLPFSHAFGWWKEIFAAHSEWVQLVNEKRGPAEGSRWPPAMCVSNPEFQQEVVRRWRVRHEKDPKVLVIQASENDTWGACQCAACRAADGPQDAYHPPLVGGERLVSDRYAKFWLALYELAAPTNPAAKVTGYAYTNYLPAPSPAIKLPANICIGYVPDVLFPRAPRDQQWVLDQWDGWRGAGATLWLRPNYFHDGYTMPHLFVHQFAAEFGHAATHGLQGFDIDSLTAQWAAQGPNFYALCRLARQPTLTGDQVLAEYASGFGAAAGAVGRYFTYWEDYAAAAVVAAPDLWRQRSSFGWKYFRVAHRLYPEESFAPAEKLLAEAAAAVQDDAPAAARVAFVQWGLEHAKLCVRLAAAAAADKEGDAYKQARAAVDAFRAAHVAPYVANYNHSAWLEGAPITWPF